MFLRQAKNLRADDVIWIEGKCATILVRSDEHRFAHADMVVIDVRIPWSIGEKTIDYRIILPADDLVSMDVPKIRLGNIPKVERPLYNPDNPTV